jgi:hypothetical protein
MPKSIKCHLCGRECDGYVSTWFEDLPVDLCLRCAASPVDSPVRALPGSVADEEAALSIPDLLLSSALLALIGVGCYCFGYAVVFYFALLSY